MTELKTNSKKLISENHKYFLLFFVGIILPLMVLVDLCHRLARGGSFSFDIPILNYIHQFSNLPLNQFMIFATNLGSPLVVMSIAIITLLILLYAKKYYSSLFFILTMGGAGLINLISKPIFHRMRPELWHHLVTETDFSFPSGHAIGTMALFLTILVLLRHTKWRYLALVIGIIYVLIIGLSRLYLGVHYPSDILAGWLAAIVWTTFIYQILQTSSNSI